MLTNNINEKANDYSQEEKRKMKGSAKDQEKEESKALRVN